MIGLKIQKSTCGEFIRIWVNGAWTLMTMTEWTKALAHAGTFRHDDDTEAEAQEPGVA